MFNLRYRFATSQRYRRLRSALLKGRMRKYIKTVIALLVSSTILVFCFHYRLSVPVAIPQSAFKAQPSTFDTLAKARLTELQARYTAEEVFETTGLKTGNFSWKEYVKEIRGVYEEYFVPPVSNTPEQSAHPDVQRLMNTLDPTTTISRVSGLLDNYFDLLSYGRNASARKVFHSKVPDSIPHVIYTTSKDKFFPPQFNTWEKLNSKAGWQVKSYNDNDIWQWMTEVFGNGKKQKSKVKGQEKDQKGKGNTDEDEDVKEALEEKIDETSEEIGTPPVLDVYQQIDNGVLRGE